MDKCFGFVSTNYIWLEALFRLFTAGSHLLFKNFGMTVLRKGYCLTTNHKSCYTQRGSGSIDPLHEKLNRQAVSLCRAPGCSQGQQQQKILNSSKNNIGTRTRLNRKTQPNIYNFGRKVMLAAWGAYSRFQRL